MATKKQTAQYASAAIIIGLVLVLTGAYQATNPVLAVEPHIERPEAPPIPPSMLAVTTFEVEAGCPSPSVTFVNDPQITFEGTTAHCEATIDAGAGQTLDGANAHVEVYNGNAYIRIEDTYLNYNVQTQTVDLQWEMVESTMNVNCYIFVKNGCGATDSKMSGYYAYTSATGAQIDDNTDTLTTDKSSYSPGDTVYMTATGLNIGDATWHGRVNFVITKPGETVPINHPITGVEVPAGGFTNVNYNYVLPSDAAIGTWTVQSIWTDDDGVVHAMASIDLGTETIWGIEINMLGGWMVLLGILILIGGIMTMRKK